MRLLLGFLLLLTLFAGALAWQRRFGESADVLAARPAALAAAEGENVAAEAHAGAPPPAARPYPSDWGRVIVGRPSGAAPLTVEAERVAPPPPANPTATPPRAQQPAQPAPAAAREFELTVERGQTLSSICQAHYHSTRPELVNALARYNKITDPARMRAGQKLRLPPESELLQH